MVIYNYIFDSVRKVGIFSVYPVLPKLVSGEIFILKEEKACAAPSPVIHS